VLRLTPYLPIIIASGLLAFLATPLTRILARRVGMLDQPGLRKAHRSPIPLLGGLAIYAALVVAFLAFGFEAWLNEGLGILGGATLMFLTGLWDDRFGMSARLKLLAQAAGAGVLILSGVQVHLLGVWWLDGLITLCWVMGITNAVNLMDNMDGLAAGTSAVAAACFFVLAALEGQGLVASLAAALFGAAAGFLFYNFAPALSFMGDAGALTLGFMLAVLGIKIEFTRFPLGATWMAPIVVLGVLIFDTTLVSVSRLRRGRSIFQGGSDHTSHRLVQLGLSSPRAVMTLYVVAGALGVLALFLTRSSVPVANTTFAALLLLGGLTLLIFERIEPKLTGDPLLVLIPGGGGFAEAVRAAQTVSRNLAVLFAPRQMGEAVYPSRAEVIETVAALAEDPDAVRGLLLRGLSEAWWTDLDRLHRALRLTGLALATGEPVASLPETDPTFTLPGEPQPEVVGLLHKARLVVLGPGDPQVNLIPALAAPGLRAALQAARKPCLWVGAEEAAQWIGPLPAIVSRSDLPQQLHNHLLDQAAAHAKTEL
jgi:UDP-GlcNAc:undecaprenyl-phosphate GlcNAc-1-phosphate transferase